MEHDFRKYKGEVNNETQSVIFNVLFVALETCGVEGPGDFKEYKIIPASEILKKKPFPLTCCSTLVDQVADLPKRLERKTMTSDSWERMVNEEYEFFLHCEPNEDGGYVVLKNNLLVLFLLVLAVLVSLLVIIVVLICVSCAVIENGYLGRKRLK